MRVEVSAKKITTPDECFCCGGPAGARFELAATRTKGVRVVKHQTRSWEFPSCEACIDHVQSYKVIAAGTTGLGCLALILGAAASCLHPLVGVFAVVGIALAAVSYRNSALANLKAKSPRSCVSLDAPATYVGWNGTIHTFDFENETFARRFMEANRNKLVNIDPALALSSSSLEAVVAERAAPQRPVINATIAFDEAVEKIERAKTAAGRRAALARAVSEITGTDEQQRLRLEASRIEVEAALDKVDGLKSKTARLRTLRKALEEIRNDQVDDELQQEQVGWLEQALRETESEE